MGSSVNTHEHTNMQPYIQTQDKCTPSHMHRCNTFKNRTHTFLPPWAQIDSQGVIWDLFYVSFIFIFLFYGPLTSGSTPLHSAGCCCCAVVLSLIIENGNGQGPIKNISDAIITLAACKRTQIVSIKLTNDLGFNFVWWIMLFYILLFHPF